MPITWGSKMETSSFIDWISVTHKRGENLLPDFVNRSHSEGKGLNGYTICLNYTTGLKVLSNPSRPDMGTHIIYSGKTLENICKISGCTRDEILQHHIQLGGQLSRLDVTIDAIDSKLELEDLWQDLEKEKATTLSSHSRTQSGKGMGYTIYVGSRKTRRKMLRIYDKALEQKWDFVDHKRIELETRRDVARNLASIYIESDCDNSVIHGSIKGVCDFPDNDIFQQIIQSQSMKIPVLPSGDGDTETWLLKQVVPSMARVLDENPEFMYKFWNAVQDYRTDKNKTENPDTN